MRKYFLLLFGVLGVILLNITEFRQQQHESHESVDTVIAVNQTSYFEAGSADYMWSLEKSETVSFVSNETKLTNQKKRGYDSFCRFFKYSNWLSLPVNILFQKPESSVNLFLFYHFSLSLLQVYLL